MTYSYIHLHCTNMAVLELSKVEAEHPPSLSNCRERPTELQMSARPRSQGRRCSAVEWAGGPGKSRKFVAGHCRPK